jgi:hypothetical protein
MDDYLRGLFTFLTQLDKEHQDFFSKILTIYKNSSGSFTLCASYKSFIAKQIRRSKLGYVYNETQVLKSKATAHFISLILLSLELQYLNKIHLKLITRIL